MFILKNYARVIIVKIMFMNYLRDPAVLLILKQMIWSVASWWSPQIKWKSGLYSNIGENQIKEIINAARLSVFFIDEDQRVTSKDIGTIEQIKYFAKQQHAKIIEAELDSQFRCNGSDGYIAWLSDVLEIRRTANDIFNNDDYTFKIFDDPNEMRDAIIKENKYHNKARLLAGYCWNWESKTIHQNMISFSWTSLQSSMEF